MKEFFPVLHTAALFSGISDDELSTMLSCLGARIGTFPKGSRLLRAGAVEEVGLVLAGSALIVQEDIWGNRNILSKTGPGQTFAEVFACAPGAVLNVSVEAESAVTVMFLHIKRVLSVCPGAAMNSTFRSPASSLRITSAWSAAGCRWSLEKCGMRACLTFIKATFFSRRQRRTVFLLLRVKNLPYKPPLGVLESADTPGRMLGFYRRRAQL